MMFLSFPRSVRGNVAPDAPASISEVIPQSCKNHIPTQVTENDKKSDCHGVLRFLVAISFVAVIYPGAKEPHFCVRTKGFCHGLTNGGVLLGSQAHRVICFSQVARDISN